MPEPRLLVVDDSPEVATLVRLLARRAGWSLQVAESAEDALDVLSGDTAFDLVLIDINLPGMSGVELARRLLAEPGPVLTVFLQSGLTADLRRAIEAGLTQVIYKDTMAQPGAWVARCREILDIASGKKPDWLLYHWEQADRAGIADDDLLANALAQGLGRDRADALAVALEPIARAGRALNLLVHCWQLLGTEEIRGLRETLEPFLRGVTHDGPTA